MDPTRLRAALDAGEVIVLDGGLATRLEAQGADLRDALWSARLLADDPGAIRDAHIAFYRAGARVATTASYQATFEGFARRGFDRPAAEALMRRSVDLALEARDIVEAESGGAAPARFVAASIGPYGAMLADGSEYRGRYGLSVAELAAFHRDRLDVLASTPCDVLAMETIPELAEVEALAALLAERASVAAWISVSCGPGGRIRGGAPVEEVADAIAGVPGVVAVGVNCSSPADAEDALARLAARSTLPLVIYPNSGEGWDAAARAWKAASASTGIDTPAARRWIAAGARLVGGCCRVTPREIAEVAAAAGGA